MVSEALQYSNDRFNLGDATGRTVVVFANSDISFDTRLVALRHFRLFSQDNFGDLLWQPPVTHWGRSVALKALCVLLVAI